MVGGSNPPSATSLTEAGSLLPGDQRRPIAGRAILLSLLIAAAFFAFALITTQIKPLRAHSPWQDDPYDIVVSFTMLIVPIVAAVTLARATLCRAGEPLPASRLVELLRASDVVNAGVAATLAADWLAVVLRVREADWGNAAPLLFGMLGVLSVVAGLSLAVGSSAHRSLRTLPVEASSTGPDWVDDLLRVGRAIGRRAGPFAPAFDRGAGIVEHRVVDAPWGLRRHPIAWAFAAATALALAITASEAVAEGIGNVAVLVLFASIGTAGLFAGLATAGWYVRFVHVARPAGTHRGISPLAIAALGAATSIPISVGFRDQLAPWLVPSLDAQPILGWEVLVVGGALIGGAAGRVAGQLLRTRR